MYPACYLSLYLVDRLMREPHCFSDLWFLAFCVAVSGMIGSQIARNRAA
jgi:hypothetical protein